MRLVNDEAGSGYRFEIGQLVSHRDQPLVSMVTGRQRSRKGDGRDLDIYELHRMRQDCEILTHFILGEVLVPVETDDVSELLCEEDAWTAAAEALSAPWKLWVANGGVESERPDGMLAA